MYQQVRRPDGDEALDDQRMNMDFPPPEGEDTQPLIEQEGDLEERKSLSRAGSMKKKKGVKRFFEFTRSKPKAESEKKETNRIPDAPVKAAESNAGFVEDDEDGGNRGDFLAYPGQAAHQFDLTQLNTMRLHSQIYADKYSRGLKLQDFQVTVAIHEARFTVSNISPALCVQVGDVKKETGEKPQEQCTYINEYFVFDFSMQPALFMDQLLVLTVYKSKKVLRANEILGSFKLDLGTIYSQPDHQFFRKWAILTNDDLAGVKGHLKCTITVSGKGDPVKPGMKPANDEEENNIEDNLLLPVNMSSTRQQARYILSIYEAEGVPIVSGFVDISYAGHQGRTSVQKGRPKLIWNESVVVTEMFPPLVRRIRIQVCSTDKFGTTIVATHFLDLGMISDDREDGFLPTFGPSYVSLYGSVVTETSQDKTTALNEGLVEGSAYKGRLLLGLEVEVLDESNIVPFGITVEPVEAIEEEKAEEKEEFVLFACIMDCSMLDKRLMNKRIHLEMSIGHSGHSGLGTTIEESLTGRHGAEYRGYFSHPYKSHSTTTPLDPEMTNKLYCSLPYGDNKPCLFVHCMLPDFRWRLFHANFLEKVAEKTETEINDIRVLMDYNREHAEVEFYRAIDVFYADCCEYQNYIGTLPPIPSLNRLDKERFRLCEREIGHVIQGIDTLRANKGDLLDDKLQIAAGMVMRIRELSYTPQDALPDVFIWLVTENKRIAYHRIPARDVIFSLLTKERGSECSKLGCFHLRIPGKKTEDEALSRIQGQVTASFWLGINQERCDLLEGMPKGYQQTSEVLNINEIHVTPPYYLEYVEKYQFELRCHLYQAKCLLALDDSGLSDPFCRIVFNGKSVTSQVMRQTLNPTWNETLVLSNVTLYGTAQHIQNYPPTVVVEIMDEDIRDEDFMGQVVAQPAVKLEADAYEKPYFPPELQWFAVHRGADHGGEVLAAFELIQLEMGLERWVLPVDVPDLTESRRNESGNVVIPIPDNIRPSLELYRIEVLFWSLRDLQRINLMAVEKPRVDVECGGFVISSDVISNFSKNPKFKNMVKAMDIELPSNPVFWPAITIRCIDFRSFGRGTLVGSTIIRKLDTFLISPDDVARDPNTLPLDMDMSPLIRDGAVGVQIEPAVPIVSHGGGGQNKNGYQEIGLGESAVSARPARSVAAKSVRSLSGGARTIVQTKTEKVEHKDEKQEMDWWTKYYASLHAMLEEQRSKDRRRFKRKKKHKNKGKRQKEMAEMALKALSYLKSKTRFGAEDEDLMSFQYHAKQEEKIPVAHLKIYPTDLEHDEDFDGFADWVKTYSLFRGQRTAALDEQKKIGKFKGFIKICKHPLPDVLKQQGLFTSIPSNDPVNVLVRVYVVKADDLRPTDTNRKSDPYLYLTLGKTKINDKENYIPNQLNPVFAKCFEFNTTFPVDSQLFVQVYDKDLFNKDDLIGETHMDLENRFYSVHRGTCGLQEKYETHGYNVWRDSNKPTVILSKMCTLHKLMGPHYGVGQVQVGRKIFMPPLDAFADGSTGGKQANEDLALYALRHWEGVPGVGRPLVPEHVEMRSLYHPERPGTIQGKLEMWVDLFTLDAVPKPAVDITARQPNPYELRVTIWNTDDVILEEMNYITGERMSDIYVKGWVQGPNEDEQNTDIHYRSLTGEGNFNWRFVFPFQYLEAEEKIVIKKKSSFFSLDEEELKMAPALDLHVYDADIISKDDFLGALQLDLTRIPRGAKTAKKCDIDIMDPDNGLPTVNLFKQRRLKGWWPFVNHDEFGEIILAGKVEAEFHLVTGEEAEKAPVGLGREEPHPLDPPKRPDTSFTFFMSPLKTVKYFLGYYKWTICKIITVILLILFFALFIYNLPGYLVKKMLNA